MEHTLYIVLGPTASGKTAFAIELAQKLQTEIISADSRQIFKQMNIGVARPTQEELSQVQHHLIACWDVRQEYNVAMYEKQALSIIDNLFANHDSVVLCGGSGLYIKAVMEGIDFIPQADKEIRLQLNQIVSTQGIEPLQEELKQKDINYYNTVDLQNPRRIIRALEVIRQTGKPFSYFLKQEKHPRNFTFKIIGLERERQDIVCRIDSRVEQMLKDGLVEEVRALVEYQHLPSLSTVGYRELFGYFNGKISLEQAVEQIKIHTRQYAKRQMTWFRKTPDVHWVNLSKQDIKIDTFL